MTPTSSVPGRPAPASEPAADALTRDLLATLAEPVPFAEQARRLLEVLATSLGYELAALWLPTVELHRLRCAVLFHELGPIADPFVERSRAATVPRGTGLVGRVWAAGAAVEIPSIVDDPELRRTAAATQAGLRSAVGLPIVGDGHLRGVIELFSTRTAFAPGPAIAAIDAAGTALGAFLRQRLDDEQRRLDAERVRLAVEGAGMGVWRWDTVTGEVFWNERMEALFGFEPGGFDGSYETYVARLHPDDRDEVLALVQEAVREQVMYSTVHRVALPDDEVRWLQSNGRPLRGDDGETVGLVGVTADITARKVAEAGAARHAELVRQLAEVGGMLAAAVSTDEVVDAIATAALTVMGAESVLVAMVDRDAAQLEVVRRGTAAPGEGAPEATRDGPADGGAARLDALEAVAPLGTRVGIHDEHPLALALRTGQVVVADAIAGAPGGASTRVLAVPLVGEHEPIGVVLFRHIPAIEVDGEHRRFLLDVGNRAATAFHRARLFAAEHAARDASERAASRLAALSRAGERFMSGAPEDEIAGGLAEVLVESVADWCHVALVDGPHRTHIDRSASPDSAALAAGAAQLAAAVARLGPGHVDDLDAVVGIDAIDGIDAREPCADGRAPSLASDDADHRAVEGVGLPGLAGLRAGGVRSVASIPIVARGAVLGAVVAGTTGARRFDDDDLSLVRELVRRSATALDNARLVDTLRRLAASFQRNLLPRQLPTIPGVELGARYEAAGWGTDVGGDFYDVFPLDDGRWVAVIGDVCGQGADAAGVTALARHTLRAVIPLSDRLTTVLERVNRMLIDHDVDDRFITIALAMVEPGPDGARLRLAQAGHPDPIVRRADGRTEAMDASRGTLLGVRPKPSFDEATAWLGPGDALVLYTDGVTEISDGTDQFGEDRLRALLAAPDVAAATADELAGRILAGALAFHGEGSTGDDLAVLTLRVPPAG